MASSQHVGLLAQEGAHRPRDVEGDRPDDRRGGLGDLQAVGSPLPHGQLVEPVGDGQRPALSILKVMLGDGESTIKIKGEIDLDLIKRAGEN